MKLNLLNRKALASFRPQQARRLGRQMAAQAKTQNFELITKGGGQYSVAGGEQLNVATAGAQALLRAGSGAFVSGNLASFKNRPAKPIELYEFEACPFCRMVREACSILDIDVLYYPCPANGPTYRAQAAKENGTGKAQHPFMKDPNTGKKMLESKDIIQYLFEQYGDGQVPTQFKLGPVSTISAGLGMLARAGKGGSYKPAKKPKEPLTIWGYEASPFVKIAREALVEYEIPHLYKTVARNSPKRKELESKWGSFQVPYLEDPNTGKAMFESAKIVEYIERTYALGPGSTSA